MTIRLIWVFTVIRVIILIRRIWVFRGYLELLGVFTVIRVIEVIRLIRL